MHATKETFIITIFATVTASALLYFVKGYKINELKQFSPAPKFIGVFIASAIIISVIFYSSFFTNASGPKDSITAYTSHFQRGLGSDELPVNTTDGLGHTKPWYYYLQI